MPSSLMGGAGTTLIASRSRRVPCRHPALPSSSLSHTLSLLLSSHKDETWFPRLSITARNPQKRSGRKGELDDETQVDVTLLCGSSQLIGVSAGHFDTSLRMRVRDGHVSMTECTLHYFAEPCFPPSSAPPPARNPVGKPAWRGFCSSDRRETRWDDMIQ